MKNVCRVKVTIFIEIMAVLRQPIYSHIHFDRHLLFWKAHIHQQKMIQYVFFFFDLLRILFMFVVSVPPLSPPPPPPPSLLPRGGNEFYRQHCEVSVNFDRPEPLSCFPFPTTGYTADLTSITIAIALTRIKLNWRRKQKIAFSRTFAKWANEIFTITTCAIHTYEYSDEHINMPKRLYVIHLSVLLYSFLL